VLHCLLWITLTLALIAPVQFWDAPARFSQDMPRTRVVMTIHNFDSSGECRCVSLLPAHLCMLRFAR